MSAQAMSVEHVDRYSSHSSVSRAGIFLAASSSAADKPPFFRGRLEAPRRSADLMLTLAHIVETRFYSPPAMVRLDSVSTCSGVVSLRAAQMPTKMLKAIAIKAARMASRRMSVISM